MAKKPSKSPLSSIAVQRKYKDPFNMEPAERADSPYKDPEYGSTTPKKQTSGSYGGTAPTAQPQQPVSTDPGYVAPNRTLTMPEYSAYDVAAPDPYNSRWQAQIDSLMGDIMNRKPFQYDLNSDALYNQAAQRYIQQGQMAMMDTMGQAAALTGGYGNSYAQQAGQQAYQGYLQGLNDNIAQYYQLAYDRYNQEGNQMRQNLSMLNQAEDSDYGRYQDKYNQWYNERAYADNRSDTQWERDYQYQKDQMSIQDENYNRLAGLISNYGYQATDEELAAAGMSRSIADTMRNAWVSANTPKATGGYRYSKKGKDDEEDDSKKTETVKTKYGTETYISGSSPDLVGALVAGGMSQTAAYNIVKNDPNYARKLIGI